VYLGVALTTLATIVLELSLTRIFSVVFYYHFAFLAISIALFGLGAGGLFSYAFRGRSRRLFRTLGILAVLDGLSVVAALVFLLSRQSRLEGGTLALVYLTTALPFFFAGAVVSTVFAETVERVHRIYFFDLLGAALGCLLLVPLLDFVGGPNTVIAAAILYAAAAAIWFTQAGSLRGRVLGVVAALLLAALVVFNVRESLLDVSYAKGERLLEELFVKWNSYSRIALATEKETGQMTIRIDGGASSPIVSLNPAALSGEQRRNLLRHGGGLPYILRPGAKTLVISPGGGSGVAGALLSGSKDVTGVELNPIIANTIMRDRYRQASQDLYFQPGVRIQVGDARNFIRSSQEQYQVIQISLPDTWDSAAAGARALSESNLFTTEAFGDYLNCLTADGLLAFTVWAFDPPRECLRLVVLAREALRSRGEFEAWRHIAVARERTGGHDRDTVLVFRNALSASGVSELRRGIRACNMRPVYLPGDSSGSPFATFLRSRAPEKFLQDYPYDVSPVSDNRPFFFHTAPAAELWKLLRHPAGDGNSASGGTAGLLLRLVGISLLGTAIILALPWLFLDKNHLRQKGTLRLLWYFAFIGAGYMLIEVALIQKFVLFLGRPTSALTVIVFSMLISSSLGGYFSPRILGTSERSLTGALAATALLIALLAVLVPPLAATRAGWPMWTKIPATVLLIAPAGFVMGMAFPTGLARLETRDHSSVRWAWALNTAASVTGSSCAIFLAIHLGLRETLLIGGVMYLGALLSIQSGKRPAVSAAR